MTRLVRFNPPADLRRMQREIDRMFESFFPTRPEGNGETETAVWSPRVDLVENENAYMIRADLPGISKDDIKISYQDGMLTISGDRREEASEEGDNFVRVERAFGHFYRSFSLPQTVDSDRIEAKFDNGVLNVRVPKSEETRPRQINIS